MQGKAGKVLFVRCAIQNRNRIGMESIMHGRYLKIGLKRINTRFVVWLYATSLWQQSCYIKTIQ